MFADEVDEHRQEYRLQDQETVYVEVQAALGDQQAQIAVSHSLDLSANGLQVLLNHSLTQGAIHQLCIDLDHPKQRIFLVAEVMWSRADQDCYRVGFKLFESSGTDIEHWKQVVAARCDSDQLW